VNPDRHFVLQDTIVGLRAELDETNYQRAKMESATTELLKEIQVLNDRLRMAEKASETSLQLMEKLLQDISQRNTEIASIHKSRTWRIGSLVLAPVRWVKRSKP
jgi:predicted  nucleic acid-binding Zn-ribbon protein